MFFGDWSRTTVWLGGTIHDLGVCVCVCVSPSRIGLYMIIPYLSLITQRERGRANREAYLKQTTQVDLSAPTYFLMSTSGASSCNIHNHRSGE